MKGTIIKFAIAFVLCFAIAFGTITVGMGKTRQNSTSAMEEAGVVPTQVTVAPTKKPAPPSSTQAPTSSAPVSDPTSTTTTTTTKPTTTTTKATTTTTLPAGKQEEEIASFGELQLNTLKYVNQARKKAGLAELSLDATLNSCAATRAKEMAKAGKLTHTRPDGSKCFTVLESTAYAKGYHGENIAYNYDNSKTVVAGWMESESHKANILSKNYTKMGIAREKDKEGHYYWCQIFVG